MSMMKRRSFLQFVAAALPTAVFAKSPQSSTPSVTRPDSSASPPVPVRKGEDRYNLNRVIPNGTSTFKVSSRDCRGQFFAMEHHHSKKGGPPRHLHTVEDEWFYVIEGEYIVEVGGQLHHLHPGDSVLGPRGIPHAFAFVGETTGRFLITYAPAGRMEEFFDSRDRAPGGRTSFVNDDQEMRKFGMQLTGPPLSISYLSGKI